MRRRSVGGARGAALLEFAVVVPLLLLLVIWVGSLGFAISQLVWLSESAYAAAVAGAEDSSSNGATAERSFNDLFTRHIGDGAAPVLLTYNEGLVRDGGANQSPLVELSVEIGSIPLAGFLPRLDLGIKTVVARLTVGGDPGDLSTSQNIAGACASGWDLRCGECGTCNPGGGDDGRDDEGENGKIAASDTPLDSVGTGDF